MNDNNILDLKAVREARNKPVTRTITHVEPEVAEEKPTHKDDNLQMLRDARRLVENDQLQGLIIIGRQPGTGIFHTNHALSQQVIPAHQLWAFIGQLHGLAAELTDIATTRAKELLADGTISDPNTLEPLA